MIWSKYPGGKKGLGTVLLCLFPASTAMCEAPAHLRLLYLGRCTAFCHLLDLSGSGRLPALNSITQVKLVQTFNVVAF